MRSSGLMDVGGEEHVLTDGPARQTVQRQRPGELAEEQGPGPGDDRRDEEEQLVDEALLEERGRERGAALEEQGLDSLAAEPEQLLLQRAGQELQLRGARKRTGAEREAPRLIQIGRASCRERV